MLKMTMPVEKCFNRSLRGLSPHQSEAIESAKKIASNEKLFCVPSIGASIFEKNDHLG